MNVEHEQRWLQPGQSQSIWMQHGAYVLVQHGGAKIVLPAEGWFDLAPRAAFTVPAGSARQVRKSGWVRLEAAGTKPAFVVLIAPAAPERGNAALLIGAGS